MLLKLAKELLRDSKFCITTGVCQSLGLPDDCEELMTMLQFCDQVLLKTPTTRQDVLRYYEMAPQIVRKSTPSLMRALRAIPQACTDGNRREPATMTRS